MKNLFFILVLSALLFACNQTPQIYTSEINFETMGTFGTVKIVSDSIIDEVKITANIDSIFIDFNNVFSTYIDSSTISKFNKLDTGVFVCEFDFTDLFASSVKYAYETNYYFNPKVLPLIKYYGFSFEEGINEIDSHYVDSLVGSINLKLEDEVELLLETYDLIKKSNIQLDFSAFAKGYGVDVIAYYLDSLGYSNYMVDIGGEVHCKGVNKDNNVWRLGIEEPNEATRAVFEVVQLENKAMATSGNYRNFKVLDNGQKIVHIINPKTGYPEISNLLSASIIADNCMTADAYATACMVMGVDTCFDFLLDHTELEGYLIYSDENGVLQSKYTEGFGENLIK